MAVLNIQHPDAACRQCGTKADIHYHEKKGGFICTDCHNQEMAADREQYLERIRDNPDYPYINQP